MVQFGPAKYILISPERGDYEGLPVSGQITDTFEAFADWRKELGFGPHSGIDIAASEGVEIKAPADGDVVTNTQQSDLGNYLTLRHDDDTYTGYCHLREPSPLAVGTRVRRGEVIGHLGRTGAATGPHLHWMHARSGNSALSRALGFLERMAGPKSVARHRPPWPWDVSQSRRSECS